MSEPSTITQSPTPVSIPQVPLIDYLKKYKVYIIMGLVIIGLIYINLKKPHIISQVDYTSKMINTVTQKYQKQIDKLNKSVAMNIKTTVLTIYRYNGSVASVSATTTNLTKITISDIKTTTTTITVVTKDTEVTKTVTKYSQTSIMAGIQSCGMFNDYGPRLSIKVDNWDFGVSYAVTRKEIDLDANIVLLAW